ncbi:M23 family metallopeptidase [Aminithiophilus ramosus]|uniref:M23 family metallopeptidase n=1 Tax=Aminithiophilus ramosus TaxID=3029084 RepID=A0A9Q7EYH3_9BACT|nr:M23 family metallopeptidase [Aminithiophilus ramosus]QTX32006.1 M23 family metallopeptidase [Aminithiophilus ramosus]
MFRRPILVLLLLLALASPSAAEMKARFIAPQAVSQGEPFLVELILPVEPRSASLRWLGREQALEPRPVEGGFWSLRALVGASASQKAGREIVAFSVDVAGRSRTFPWQIEIRSRSFPESRLTVEEKMVVPPEEARSRIEKESRRVQAALASSQPSGLWTLPLNRPVKGIVTCPYGWRRVYNGKPRSPHSGVDLRAGVGASVRSLAPGRVLLAEEHYFAGNVVYVDHGGGVVSAYAHLSRIDVAVGQDVERGQVLGLAGATGRVTGPHLHLGLFLQGRSVDAMPLFEEDLKGLLEGRQELEIALG